MSGAAFGVTGFPFELKRATEEDLTHAFSPKERSRGVTLLDGTKPLEFWKYLTVVDARDLTTREELPTLQEVERRVQVHANLEMEASAEHHRALVQMRKLRWTSSRSFGHQEKLRSAASKVRMLHEKWARQNALKRRHEDTWTMYRNERRFKLDKAISMQSAMDLAEREGTDQRSNYPWWPSGELFDALRDEVAACSRPVRMTRYYTIQNLTGVSGVPMFSPLELRTNGVLTGYNDDEYDAPLPGTAEQRMKVAMRQVLGVV